MIRKLLALLLAAVLLGIAVSACAGKGGGTETGAQTQGEEESNLYPDELPSLNFNGADIRIVHPEANVEEIFVETPGGELVDEAVYRTQMVVEDRLGVTYRVMTLPGQRNVYSNEIVNTFLGQQDLYDIVGNMIIYSCLAAAEGVYADMRAMKYLDFTKPYWNNEMAEGFTVDGHLYFASGDAEVSYLKYISCMLCNTLVAADYKIDPAAIQQSVLNGTWTAEEMKSMALSAYNVADPSALNREIDTVGLIVPERDHACLMLASLGVRMLDKDGTCTFGTAHAIDAAQWLVSLFNDNVQCAGTFTPSTEESKAQDQGMFRSRRALFVTAKIDDIAEAYQEMVGDLIVLPLPKWSEEYEYSTYSRGVYLSSSIMRSCPDTDLASAVLECMASVGSAVITPAYYEEAMKIKYSDATPESKEIFDIIHGSVAYDWGYYAQYTFAPSGSAQLYVYTNILNNDAGWAMAVNARKTAWERGITAYLDKLANVEIAE